MLTRDFNKGDFLYGLTQNRDPVIQELEARLGEEVPVTVDQLNKFLLLLVRGDDEDEDWTSEKETAFYEYLNDPKNASVILKNKDSIRKHYEILKDSGVINRNDFPTNIKNLLPSLRTRIRICKNVLLTYPNTQNSKIHFMLDGINLRIVVDRKYAEEIAAQQLKKGGKHTQSLYKGKVSDMKNLSDAYTSAELRFIFKYLDKIKANSLIFYIQGRKIDLFDWIAKQPDDAKKALIDWVHKLKARGTKKISDQHLDKILQKVTYDAEQTAPHVVRSPGSPIYTARRRPIAASPSPTFIKKRTRTSNNLFGSPEKKSKLEPEDSTLPTDPITSRGNKHT